MQHLDCGRRRHRGLAEDNEGLRLEGVADQQGSGLVICHMAGGLAAAQGVVVHAGHVVMDQGIRMDHFHRAGGEVEQVGRNLEYRAGTMAEQRAHPLAAVQGGIAHGLMQPQRGDLGGRETGFEGLFGTMLDVAHPGGEIHGNQSSTWSGAGSGGVSGRSSFPSSTRTVSSAAPRRS